MFSSFSLSQLNDEDQKIYNRFNVVVSDRWQAEMMGKSRGCGQTAAESRPLILTLFLLQRVFLKRSTRREKSRNQRKSQKSKMESYVSQTR